MTVTINPRMAQFMAPTRLDLTPEDLEQGGDFGFALLSGRLVVGVVSERTQEQITVRAVCKTPPAGGGRWQATTFDELHRSDAGGRVYLDVPQYDRAGGDDIGFYDVTLQTFYPAAYADPARVWAALYVLSMAAGRDPALLLGVKACSQARIHASDRCIHCGREIWLEQSVQRHMGETCYGQAAETVHQQRALRGSNLHAPRPPRKQTAAAVEVDDVGLRTF